ncbi:MAG: hypothetical protein ABIR08_13295 [Sphingomonas sp.]
MQRADYLTIAGWGLLLTMWHEIGGHAAVCALQGGHVTTIGAFYVDCDGLSGFGNIFVACAGVFVNIILAVALYFLWRRAVNDTARIILWLVWVSEAFVASGYFLFSGVTGFGDLGIGEGGSLSTFEMTWPAQIVEIVIGLASYILLVRAAIGALNSMIGNGPETRRTRRVIAHVYYASAGAAAVLVGLLNPLGIVITVMSAAASSFGGLAGFISIGYAVGNEGEAKPVALRRNLAVVGAGVVVLAAFALILGPSVNYKR